MKKILAIFLVLIMVVAMMASCFDDDGPIVGGTPPTYGEESTPANETPAQSQPRETEGGVIELPIDPFK